MALLPKVQSSIQDLNTVQSLWSAILNPILANPVQAGLLLKQVSLGSGGNVVNHKLGRRLQGWMIVRRRAAATVFDTQDINASPDKTLLLVSDAPVTVDLYVF